MRRALALMVSLAFTGAARASDLVEKLTPVTINLRPPRTASPRDLVLTVRVYAAADFTSQSFKAEAHFRQALERVNGRMQPWPGVRFEIESYRPWEIDSSRTTMEAMLAALAALDRGDETDLVLGLASAVPVFPGNLHNLGMAELYGRHAIIRGLHDLSEYDAIKDLFQQSFKGETTYERVIADRKAHKEEVLFLHEWAHTLGALHVGEERDLMNPSYDSHQGYFSPGNAQVMELYLKRREQAASDPAWRDQARADLRAFVERAPAGRWSEKDRAGLLAQLSGAPQIQKENPGGVPKAGSIRSSRAVANADDRKLFNQAFEMYKAGDAAGALKLVAGLAERLPDEPAVQGLACELTFRAGDARVEGVCRHYADLDGSDPFPLLALADSRLKAKDEARANSAMAGAEERLARAGGDKSKTWAWLAELYGRSRLPTLAERAAAHADPETVARVGAWARTLRRRRGLPVITDGELRPPAEADYLADVERIEVAVDTGKLEAAGQLVADFERRHPKLPAAPMLRCRIEVEARRFAVAEKHCRAALARDEELPRAWFHLAVIATRRGKLKAAIPPLRRAIELDPEMEAAWKGLAAVLEATHDRAAREALRKAYRAQFGTRKGYDEP